MSKLTIHFQRIPAWFVEFVNRCQGRLQYIVGVDVFPKHDDLKILGRTYLPDGESNELVNRGVAGADAWIDRFARVYSDNPHVHRWIGPNEYVLWDKDHADRFNAFHVRFIERMSGLGHGVMCGQINTGWPRLRKYSDPPPYPEALAPTLTALWVHGGIFSLHEYWPGGHDEDGKPVLTDPTGNILRYRDTRAALLQAGITNLPVFFGSELGVDMPTSDPAADYDHWGWRHFIDWPTYFQMLKGYSGEMDKDSYMLGASIFTEGGGWESFELDPSHALALADFVASDEPPPPPPPVERAQGLDLNMFSGDVNFDALKAAGYKWLGIRFTGPNADRTKMIVDPNAYTYHAGAGEAGLLRLGYHGLMVGVDGQAKFFVDAVGGRKLEMGYWSDLEDRALTDDKCRVHLEAVDRRIAEAHGLEPGIYDNVYTSPGFMDGRDGSWGKGRELWLAHWTYDPSLEPKVPEPWKTSGYKLWQWTNQGVNVPGTEKRVCLDLYNGTTEELYEEYGKPENGGNGGSDVIEIVDRNGDPVVIDGKTWTWETVQQDYGLSLTKAEPPEGATVFRLVRLIYDASADTNWRLYVLDKDGKPLQGIVGFLGILPDSGTELEPDQAPRLSEDVWAQPEGRPNRALVLQPPELNFSNLDGYIEHSLGSGSNTIPPRPGSHWAWIMPGDYKWYSDVPAGFGLWDNHKMFWPVFQMLTGEDPEPPPPEGAIRITGTVTLELDITIETVEGTA